MVQNVCEMSMGTFNITDSLCSSLKECKTHILGKQKYITFEENVNITIEYGMPFIPKVILNVQKTGICV